MPKSADIWTYLKDTDKTVVMYGMGNGADKILSVCGTHGIEVSDFFASDGFVRGHLFHGKRVLSYSEIKEKYGKENIIILLSFASSLPDVLENIYKIADECELYAPDVPVCGETLFDASLYETNKDKIKAVEGLLFDEESKEIYRSVIDYKLHGDIRLLRGNHSSFKEVYRDLLGAEGFCTVADLGAYNGDTVRELSEVANNLKLAIALEPDKRNNKKLCDYAKDEDRFEIETHKVAAWSERATLTFGGSGNRNSSISSGGSIPVGMTAKTSEIEADALDNIVGDRAIDYIKYDVEGAEKEAIEGSDKTIRNGFPALMISLYHRSEDMFELPLMIREKYPAYKLYIRRREYIPAWDTVLLAVKEDK